VGESSTPPRHPRTSGDPGNAGLHGDDAHGDDAAGDDADVDNADGDEAGAPAMDARASPKDALAPAIDPQEPAIDAQTPPMEAQTPAMESPAPAIGAQAAAIAAQAAATDARASRIEARASLSVVIPTLNAVGTLAAAIAAVPWAAEIIVADGGSRDGTAAVAASLGARIVTAPRGRGQQLAAGMAGAAHGWLLLMHADTTLSLEAEPAARAHIQRGPASAGYFRFALDSADARARRLERLVAWRCRTFGLPYGDQGLLIHRDLLHDVGGIRPLPLMEDVDLVRRLGRRRLRPLDAAAVTSATRWERDGWYRRSARNLLCLGLWFAGLPPRHIAMLYR